MSGSDTIKCRNLILVGKTGNGKSSTGNTILNEKVFESKLSAASVTQECKMRSGFNRDVDREFSVIDTPGLFDTDRRFAERALEIQASLKDCPNPHAFLIIMSTAARFTEEEELTIDVLRVIFGEEFLNHAIIVYTRGSEFSSDEELKRFVEGNKSLCNLKKECGDRVVRIENNPSAGSAKVREELMCNFLEMVEQVSDKGNTCYRYNSLSVHRGILEEHLKNIEPGAKLGYQLKQLVKELGEQLKDKESWRPYVVGSLYGVAAVGAVGGAYLAAPAVLAVGEAAATGQLTAMAGTAFSYVVQGGAAVVGGAASIFGKLRFK